jgi:hypothetical protein
MNRILLVITLLIVGTAGAYWFFSRNDPLTDFLNTKWPPISVDQQRQQAINTSASALNSILTANVAAGVDTKTIERFAVQLLKPKGVTAVKVAGDQELFRMEVDFEHVFSVDDLPPDFNGRELIAKLKPDIEGTVILFVGITGSAADPKSLSLQLKLLPAISSIHLKKTIVGDRSDVTSEGSVLVSLVNHYSENITAALNAAPFLDISVASTLPSVGDSSGEIKVAIPGAPDVKVRLSAQPFKSPFRVGGVAWLVDGSNFVALAQLVRIGDSPKTPLTVTSSTFSAMKDGFLAHLKAGLDVSALPGGVWLVLTKALVSEGLNSAFAQAEPCISAQGPVPTQSLSKKVSIPDETTMECAPKKACDLHVDERECHQTRVCNLGHDERDCNQTRECNQGHDERDCNKCLVSLFGSCKVRGNDPVCEAQKAAQNAGYATAKVDCEAEKTAAAKQCEAEKAAQNVAYAAAKAECEGEREVEKGVCEGEKELLKRLSRTGKFANIDVSMGGPATLKICPSAVNLSTDLTEVSLNLGVDGGADVATRVKFVPLDIIGHLACQVPWTEDRTFNVTIPAQAIPVKANLTAKIVNGKQAYDGHIDEVMLKLHFEPSPTVLLLQNTNFTLACLPLAGLIDAVTLNIGPLIPDLLKDFDFKQKAVSFSFVPKLPDVKVFENDLKTTLSETRRTIMLTGEIVEH